VEVGVLSPYAQQVQQLHKALGPTLRQGLRYRQSLTAGSESVRRAHTVDSFQGNEADIVCISMVRNNRNKEPGKALGFLSEAERMNVLISRGSRLLVLAGCWEFFQKNLEFVDPDDPDLGHLKRLLQGLEKLFDSDAALRLPIEKLV
jgi:superfamily I DNA and/or RNA helicase